MLVIGVGACAFGPRPSSVGRPTAAVKLASLPPPVRLRQGRCREWRRSTWACSKRRAVASVRSMGGRLKRLEGQARCREWRAIRNGGRLDAGGLGDRPGSDVDARPWPSRGRRCGGAAFNRADVDGGTGRGVGQAVDVQDLVGKLDDGACALSQARCRRGLPAV